MGAGLHKPATKAVERPALALTNTLAEQTGHATVGAHMQRIEVEEGPAHAAGEPGAGVRGARDGHPPVQPQPHCVAQAMQRWTAMLLI